MPVTTTEYYGSRNYESVVLSHTPTAAFGPYVSTTATVDDLTNNDYLTASFTSASAFQRQIPFFALFGDDYTFQITPSNKLIVKENTGIFPRAIGAGRFARGDEDNEFSVEFLLSHNHSTDSSTDFARFGTSGSQHCLGLSYSNTANQFYLTVYSQDGYTRYRSVVQAGLSRTSKHIVIAFKSGIPIMYVNGIRARELINQLTGTDTFLSQKVSGRTVAEFSTSSDTQPFLISMLAFYDYCLSESTVLSHYKTLFDIGDFKDYISAHGSALLHELIPFNQRISRNDGAGQDFFGAATRNVNDSPFILPLYRPNFYPSGADSQYLSRTTLASGYGVSQSGGFSFKSDDFDDYLDQNSLQITFAGGGTGKYTKDTPLLYMSNTSVGDFHVSIDSASSKVYIGSGSAQVLAAMSSSVAQQTQTSISISTSGSTIYVSMADGSDSASYSFADNILYVNTTAYLFNRYYFDATSGSNTTVGNSLLDFTRTYAGDGENLYVSLTTPMLTAASVITWTPSQRVTGEVGVSFTAPAKEYNYFKSNHSSDAISYVLYVDGASAVVYNDSMIRIPTTASSIVMSASMSSDWNGSMNENMNNVWIKDMALYNFGAASYAGGGYPAVLESSSGVINSQDTYLNIFRQPNMGFMQTASNVLRLSTASGEFNGISQVDFMISLPAVLSASSQTLFRYGTTASMGLVYNAGSNVYVVNFTGMTASVNSYSATSGSTTMSPRQPYFVQMSLSSSVETGSYAYLFSNSDGSNQFQHSFDLVSVFPSEANNARARYAQVFGRRSLLVSDNEIRSIRIESVPDDSLLVNKTWQIYTGE